MVLYRRPERDAIWEGKNRRSAFYQPEGEEGRPKKRGQEFQQRGEEWKENITENTTASLMGGWGCIYQGDMLENRSAVRV